MVKDQNGCINTNKGSKGESGQGGAGRQKNRLYDVIVHPHRYLQSEIGLIVVSSFSSSSSSSPNVSLLPENGMIIKWMK